MVVVVTDIPGTFFCTCSIVFTSWSVCGFHASEAHSALGLTSVSYAPFLTGLEQGLRVLRIIPKTLLDLFAMFAQWAFHRKSWVTVTAR